MGLIFKIAWRNIQRHKGKTFVIGSILFLGALIMTFGNGVISGMEKGLEKNIIDGFTGDIVIISDKQESDNVLFTLMGKAIEPINNFIDIDKVLKQQDYIDQYLPAGRNMAMILNEEGGAPGFAFLLGVDIERYQKMFPDNIEIVEGRLLKKNEAGALIPTGSRKEFYNLMNQWYVPQGQEFNLEHFKEETEEQDAPLKNDIKDSIVFLGYNEKNTTMDIRLDIKGIVKFKALNSIFGSFNIVDIESYRNCQGYFSAASKSVALKEDKKELLAMDTENMDDMFSEGEIFSDDRGSVDESVLKAKQQAEIKHTKVDVDEGAYNVVFVKLKKGVDKEDGLILVNKILKDNNLAARAVTWKQAFGVIGSMSSIIKGSLFGFVMLLFVVAIIIIVNTLSMAALERITEIGMMRAVGARKSFVGKMFLGETAMLAILFGGAGIIVGILITIVVSMLGITSDNDLVQLLYGGDTFNPVLSAGDVLLTMIQLLLVTLIAVIYPLKVARSITPLDAIARD